MNDVTIGQHVQYAFLNTNDQVLGSRSFVEPLKELLLGYNIKLVAFDSNKYAYQMNEALENKGIMNLVDYKCVGKNDKEHVSGDVLLIKETIKNITNGSVIPIPLNLVEKDGSRTLIDNPRQQAVVIDGHIFSSNLFAIAPDKSIKITDAMRVAQVREYLNKPIIS